MKYAFSIVILACLFFGNPSFASERSFQSEEKQFLESLHAEYVKELEFQKPNYVFVFSHPHVKMKIKDCFLNLLDLWEECLGKIRVVHDKYPEDPVLTLLQDKFQHSLSADDLDNAANLMLLVFFGIGDIHDVTAADEILEISVESMLKTQMIESAWEENEEISLKLTKLVEQDKFRRILAVAEKSPDPFLMKFFQECKDQDSLEEHLEFLECDDDFYDALDKLDIGYLTEAQEEVQQIFAEFQEKADHSLDLGDLLK